MCVCVSVRTRVCVCMQMHTQVSICSMPVSSVCHPFRTSTFGVLIRTCVYLVYISGQQLRS